MRSIKGSLVGLVLAGILALRPPPRSHTVEEAVDMVEASAVAAISAAGARLQAGDSMTTVFGAITIGSSLVLDSGSMPRRDTWIIPTTAIMTTIPATIPRPLLPCRRS